MRLESAEQAAELDRRIEEVWSEHPNRLIVPATESFPEKLEHVTSLIMAELRSSGAATKKQRKDLPHLALRASKEDNAMRASTSNKAAGSAQSSVELVN